MVKELDMDCKEWSRRRLQRQEHDSQIGHISKNGYIVYSDLASVSHTNITYSDANLPRHQ